jgi:hypothetical protein
MRHSTLFIQETKNRRVLGFFMPFNLFVMNIFTTLSTIRVRATRVVIARVHNAHAR